MLTFVSFKAASKILWALKSSPREIMANMLPLSSWISSSLSANSFNSSLTDLGSLVDCGSGREVGWCSVSPSYPTHLVEEMVTGCEQVLEAYKAVISQDLDLLGDNSPSIISSEKDHSRPWSWKVILFC